MTTKTKLEMPKPMLIYIGNGKFDDTRHIYLQNLAIKDENVLSHWLFQDNGETYRTQWWGNGWVVFFQESYLCKETTYLQLQFRHKNDIPSFEYSHFPALRSNDEEWVHVFETEEEAIETFKDFWINLYGK